MAQGHCQPSWADGPRQEVLSSPELVERILAQLEAPMLLLGPEQHHPSGTKRLAGDRWTASQVSRTFCAAALRLPWRAELVDSDTGAVGPGADALCRGRAVTHLHLKLNQQTPAAEAALLCCGPTLESLEVSVVDFLPWLRSTLLRPQAAAAGGPVERVPLLTHLASLSRLTVLKVAPLRAWQDASWLNALPQLKRVRLLRFDGAPVGGLPHLESLCVEQTNPTHATYEAGSQPEVTLEQWAAPRLTGLCFMFYTVLLRCPPRASAARTWLHGLQTLELGDCDVKLHTPRWREVVPSLTFLRVAYRRKTNSCIDGLLLGGLPPGLKQLHLMECTTTAREQPWAALAGLTRLEVAKLSLIGRCVGLHEAELAVVALSPLPKLEYAQLVLLIEEDTAVAERFSNLEAQMAARGALLQLGYLVRAEAGPDRESSPSEDETDTEADHEEDPEEDL